MAHRYRHWTVLQTKQASSLVAAKNIQDQGFPVHRPLYRTQPHPINHVRHVKQLFERYLFVQVDRRKNWQVLGNTRGVSQLFLTANQPHEIDDTHIEWLRSLEDAGGYVVIQQDQPPVFTPEQEVRGIRGLFEGIQGIYLGHGKNPRDYTRRVLFNIMGRSVAFEVKAHDLIAA